MNIPAIKYDSTFPAGMRDERKSEILGQYNGRSAQLVGSNMDDIAHVLSGLLLKDPPYGIPKEHRKEFNGFRGGLAREIALESPYRNTELRKRYKEIARLSLVLLDNPDDGTGNITELLKRWCAHLLRVKEHGFDIDSNITTFDGVLDELTDPALTLDYAVDHLLFRQGINGSMFTKPPVFTPSWKGGYVIWSFMSAAVDVIGSLPQTRYFGRN